MSVAELLVKLAQCSKAVISSCRYQHALHRPVIELILEKLCCGSTICAGLIKPLMCVSLGESAAEGSSGAEEVEERLRRQKEARERALAQMAAQQVWCV
jgi:hypothetical protein